MTEGPNIRRGQGAFPFDDEGDAGSMTEKSGASQGGTRRKRGEHGVGASNVTAGEDWLGDEPADRCSAGLHGFPPCTLAIPATIAGDLPQRPRQPVHHPEARDRALSEFNGSSLDPVGPVGSQDQQMRVLNEMNELGQHEEQGIRKSLQSIHLL